MKEEKIILTIENIRKNKYILIHLDEKWFSDSYIKKFTDISPDVDEFHLFIKKVVKIKKTNLIITTGTIELPFIKKITNKLVIMKLSPNVTSISEIGQAAQEGGADAVSAINTLVGMAIDINSKKPKLSTNMGGLSGPCIKPVALANIFKLYNSLDIPIIGIGGISNDKDVVEFLLAGASLVQLGTINYKYPNLVNSIPEAIEDYFKLNSISNINQIIGALRSDD